MRLLLRIDSKMTLTLILVNVPTETARSMASAFKQFNQFVDLALTFPVRSTVKGIGYAMLEVIAQNLLLYLAEGSLDRSNLGQDINAITILVDHAGNAAHLPFDPAEARELRRLQFRDHALNYTLVGYKWQA